MKKAKLIFSIIMAAVMICVSVVPAFAMTEEELTNAKAELEYRLDDCNYTYVTAYNVDGWPHLPVYSVNSTEQMQKAISEIRAEFNSYTTEEEFTAAYAKISEAEANMCVSSDEIRFFLNYLEKDYNSVGYYDEETTAKIKEIYEEAQSVAESGDEQGMHSSYLKMRNLLNKLCIYNTVPGDVDQSQSTNIKDVALIQLELAKLNNVPFNSSQRYVADMDKDADITNVTNWQLSLAKLNDYETFNENQHKRVDDLKAIEPFAPDTRRFDEDEERLNDSYDYDRYWYWVIYGEDKTEFSKGTVNLMENITQGEPEGISDSYDYEKFNSFAIDLIRYNMNYNENITASPASAIYALGMAANGADGKTNEEMLSLFNVNSNEELNKCLYQFMVKKSGENSGVNIANSMWINKNSGFNANEEFLQTNADYYNSDVFSAAFDGNTANDINKWVSGNTHGRIPEIVEKLDNNTVMLLINTVLFDADWYTPFEASYSGDREFTNADGTRSIVKMMYSDYERYIEDDNTTGFIKEYENGYEFVALLPQENVSIEEYLNALTPEKLSNLFSQNNSGIAEVTLPAFKINNSINLNESLKKMGMINAFDGVNADFSRMSKSQNGGFYISSVSQKAEIAVDELGTKASAATVVDVVGSTMPGLKKIVDCDRPFLYFIIDGETKMPLFAGAYVNGN